MCVCVCVHAHLGLQVCIPLCVHVEVRGGSWLSYHSLLIPLRQGLSLNLDLGWHLESPSDHPIFTPLTGLFQMCTQRWPAFYMSSRDLNSVLHACVQALHPVSHLCSIRISFVCLFVCLFVFPATHHVGSLH